ncbi:transmembrane protein, putative (macronuclear) [Tetrahymena thermophila SB210]|uniref:Transmembrane protein, putative n=1 Tax=Tetrahymena thermophila (strain SB210) TaxID=312017 RepID=W7XGE2_TETTS|nr:transmembrane protein, putative [Tetrahymena thermophila SB210]EWS71954.1 transmembrane protein, putative [Tetrahymena thermophila SB210]|eukprot:XP_012655514.1 transmembrane protein, putative [Tetrahymena thermophila SB210]
MAIFYQFKSDFLCFNLFYFFMFFICLLEDKRVNIKFNQHQASQKHLSINSIILVYHLAIYQQQLSLALSQLVKYHFIIFLKILTTKQNFFPHFFKKLVNLIRHISKIKIRHISKQKLYVCLIQACGILPIVTYSPASVFNKKIGLKNSESHSYLFNSFPCELSFGLVQKLSDCLRAYLLYRQFQYKWQHNQTPLLAWVLIYYE